MRNPLRFPLRLKILVALLLVVTAVVSVITFTMANMFHDDKRTYVTDLVSLVAVSTADECRSELEGYGQRLQAYARVLGDQTMQGDAKKSLLRGLFSDFPELVGIDVYENGKEVASAYDAAALGAAGVAKDEAKQALQLGNLPAERILAGEPFLRNASIRDKLPALTLAVPEASGEGEAQGVVVGLVRMDRLIRLAARSRVLDVSLWDSTGTLLADRDPRRVVRREKAAVERGLAAASAKQNAGITMEYDIDGTEMIGGFASVNFAGVNASAQIPKAAAYLASRSLLTRLLIVALVLLVTTALVGVLWARRLTRPIERLSSAAREIGKGHFDAKVNVVSADEIGELAGSFNRMAGELDQRDRALKEAEAQLVQSEKMAAFGLLGAGIAHEVKNPLAGILGCAQLSLRKAEVGSPIHTNLQLIEKETKRCKTIIENLLKFARQETTSFEPMDVNVPMLDAMSIVRHQLELSKVKLRDDLGSGLPRIKGNANQLQQVFMNLLINAQQAMGADGGSVTVSSREVDEERIEVRVADTGPGIPKEIQWRIFDPFFTTKPNGKGTGLGLSVTYGIVKDHGGEIGLESEVGKGATFVITLPAIRADHSAPLVERKPDFEPVAS
jgi:two-component system NtrC family sensor kinase